VTESSERVEHNLAELEALLTRVRETLGEDAYQTLQAVVETLAFLTRLLQDKNTTIGRLRKLIFGARTEKRRNVFPKTPAESAETDSAAADSTPDDAPTPGADAEPAPQTRPTKPKNKPKGHGRNGAAAYLGATHLPVSHPCLCPGDACPLCQKGKLYRLATPGTLVCIIGQAPLHATVLELEKLRCSLCGKVFTAEPPEGIGTEKYDASAASMIALLKYGSGLPFYRLEGLQASLRIPLPSSTQWDIVHACAQTLRPGYQELIRQAAQGEVVYHDDTGMKILELMGAQPKGQPPTHDPPPERRAVFTSGILSTREGVRIALFFTGPRHAGENLVQLLDRRAAELGPPIQMCDAASRNMPKELETIIANCLAHGRRRFVDMAENFPDECCYVLDVLAEVYHTDALAKEQAMSPDERLRFHQEQSGPRMQGLHKWLTAQLEQRKVEPNSGLGEAISYLLKHWKKLTLFLREPGAPLDNNLCEQALKRAILHRKTRSFSNPQNGARVGDLFMSLIHTCRLCGVDPFAYLTKLQKHAEQLSRNPSQWMPWNYVETLRHTSEPRAAPL
jgi:transposase